MNYERRYFEIILEIHGRCSFKNWFVIFHSIIKLLKRRYLDRINVKQPAQRRYLDEKGKKDTHKKINKSDPKI